MSCDSADSFRISNRILLCFLGIKANNKKHQFKPKPKMNEIYKAENMAKAIKQLPKPKTFKPLTVTVLVGKLKYTFEKHNDEWCFVF